MTEGGGEYCQNEPNKQKYLKAEHIRHPPPAQKMPLLRPHDSLEKISLQTLENFIQNLLQRH